MIEIKDILEPTGVKVAELVYTGTADPYIIYQQYNENGEAFAENKEIATSYYFQIDIWTKGDFKDLSKQVLKLMIEAGFYRTFSTELYEKDTKLKHKIIRFQYVEEHLDAPL